MLSTHFASSSDYNARTYCMYYVLQMYNLKKLINGFKCLNANMLDTMILVAEKQCTEKVEEISRSCRYKSNRKLT